jgi:hypothetical protein
MKKLILLFIVCVIFISCDKDEVSQNEDSDDDSKTEFEFDGSEVWVDGFSEFFHGYYIEEDSPIAIGSIVYKLSSSDEHGTPYNPRLEVYLVDEILATSVGKILSLSRKYVYYSQSFKNEQGIWCRFIPQWRYIDTTVVGKFVGGLDVDSNFYGSIESKVLCKNNNNNFVFKSDSSNSSGSSVQWQVLAWRDRNGEKYNGNKELNLMISEEVYSVSDLKLLVDTFITGFNSEEEKLEFIGKISEGFFDGNKSREPWLDMVLKYSEVDNGIVFDPFWRKNEVGLSINLTALDTVSSIYSLYLQVGGYFGEKIVWSDLSYYPGKMIISMCVVENSLRLFEDFDFPIIK